MPCEPAVDPNRGFCSLLLNDLSPGTYLLGVRQQRGDHWFWHETALTVASSWWRTEVYLDCIDDSWSGRRFDIESASVLIGPGKGSGSLYGSESRLTEVARLALLEGRLGVDEHLLHWVRDMGMPEPMLALYTAYALSLSPEPDVASIRELCRQLRNGWTSRSADVKLLERWCAAKDTKSAPSTETDLRPDEVPMIARGWELSRKLGFEGQVALGAQFHVGMWRTPGSFWTQTQVPDLVETRQTLDEVLMDIHASDQEGGIDLPRIAATLGPLSPKLSPLQQALRRALINSAESDEPTTFGAFVEGVASMSGLDHRIVLSALNGIRIPPFARGTEQGAADFRLETTGMSEGEA